jgi:DNA-directed RNA polymerase beta subunit
MKQKLKLKSDFVINNDIVRENIFCVPMYVNKLFKLTKSIVNTRDFGMIKDITQQPVRGRSRGGGSRLGQMEIEGLLAAGCDQTVKELLTVKSDRNEEKRKLVREIIETGEFNMNLDEDGGGGQTKKVVSAILDFLKE